MTDEEYKELLRLKADQTWRAFVLTKARIDHKEIHRGRTPKKPDSDKLYTPWRKSTDKLLTKTDQLIEMMRKVDPNIECIIESTSEGSTTSKILLKNVGP